MGLRRPQVIINEKILTSFVSPPGNRVAAMIGTASWGPINEVKNINSLPEFINIFGDERSTDGLTLIKGADLFFRNGGTLKVVRIDDGTADYADVVLQGLVEETPTNMITLQGKYKGTLGNNIYVKTTANGSNIDITISNGLITEIFNNNGLGYEDNDEIVAAINTFSTIVTAVLSSGQGANLLSVVSETYLTGGLDGDSGIDAADYTAVINGVLLNEQYNYLLCPGQTDDATHNTILSAIVTRASTEKLYSRFISGVGVDEDIATIGARTTFDKRFSLIAPNVIYTNRYSGESEVLDGSYLACAYTGKLCTIGYGESMTRKPISVDGLSINSTTGLQYYSKSEQEQVLQNNAIPITNLNGEIAVVRAITRVNSETSLLFEEIIVDVSDLVRSRCQIICDTYLGQPNTTETRDLLASELNSEMTIQLNLGNITEFVTSTVVEGTSSDSMVATIGYKPVRATNFIYFNINIS